MHILIYFLSPPQHNPHTSKPTSKNPIICVKFSIKNAATGRQKPPNSNFFISFHTSTYKFHQPQKYPDFRPNAQVRPTKGDVFFSRHTSNELRNTSNEIRDTQLVLWIRNTSYELRNTGYEIRFTLHEIVALHLSRVLYKFAPFYAKQTQFAGCSNERKYC